MILKIKKGAASLAIAGALFALPALAADPVPGDACTTDNQVVISGGPELSGAGHVMVCNGANWISIMTFDDTGKSAFQVDDNSGGSCGANQTGQLSYDGSTWEYCTGSAWTPFEHAGCAGPSDCDTPGDVCTDGTVFAGCVPPNYHLIFTTRCDANQQWDGNCDDTPTAHTGYTWNSDGTTTNDRASGVTDQIDGRANTTALTNGVENGTGDSKTTAGVQDHNAAKYCADLAVNGWGTTSAGDGTIYTDWYLPARMEVLTMYAHRSAIGGFYLTNTSASSLWSSSEWNLNNAWVTVFRYGDHYNTSKSGRYVRCVRRRD